MASQSPRKPLGLLPSIDIAIATRASKIFHDEDMEVEFGSHTGHFELSKFVLTKSTHNLERLWTWVTRAGGRVSA